MEGGGGRATEANPRNRRRRGGTKGELFRNHRNDGEGMRSERRKEKRKKKKKKKKKKK
jgi:hypothetical protein